MADKHDVRSLIQRSKDGAVSNAELREVADVLEANQGGGDTYEFLYILARSEARSYEDLVAGFLEYRHDPMVARLALQTLCTFWGLTDKYRDAVSRFLKGVDWDYFGEVRQIAITAAGEFLSTNQDCVFLDQLLLLADSANEEEVERRIAIEAIARALSLSLKESINPDLSSVTWEDWADGIRARGQERFASECA